MTINGRAFVGNTPVFRGRVGERVQWDVLTIGDDFTRSTCTATAGAARRDVTGHSGDRARESFRVGWREDTPGTWLYHCHVESHMMNGMIAIYRVSR